MALTSDEVNLLVYRYLQESGFEHTAFSFGYESQVVSSPLKTSEVPPGALISFILKGIQYLEIEAAIENMDDEDIEKQYGTPFKLLMGKKQRGGGAKEAKSAGGKGKETAGRRGGGRKSRQEEESEEEEPRRKGNQSSQSATPVDDEDMTETTPESTTTSKASILAHKPDPMDVRSEDALVLEGHESEVFVCRFNSQKPLLASSAGDGTARIWDLSRLGSISDLSGKSSDEVLSVVPRITLNHVSGDPAVTIKDVTTVEWNHEGTYLATGSYDGLARVWDTEGNLKSILNQHAGPIFSLKWNKSGTHLLSGSVDKSSIVWDVNSSSAVRVYKFHVAPTLDVDWRDDKMFATCSTDMLIYVHSVDSDDILQQFKGHTDEVNAVRWNPEGSLLASCSDDSTAMIWKMGSDSPVSVLKGHEKEIYTVAWSPSGPGSENPNQQCRLATASFDTVIRIWDVETGNYINHFKDHTEPVYSIAWSPNGEYIASGSFDRTVRIWELKSGKLVKVYRGDGGIFDVCWSSDGRRLACSFSDASVRLLDLRL